MAEKNGKKEKTQPPEPPEPQTEKTVPKTEPAKSPAPKPETAKPETSKLPEPASPKAEPSKPSPAGSETRNPNSPKSPKSEAKNKGLERVYIIPLRKAFDYTRTKRARRAIGLIRAFAQRHMKCQAVKLDTKVNELVWARGIQKIPRKVKVRLEKVDELTTIYLAQ